MGADFKKIAFPFMLVFVFVAAVVMFMLNLSEYSDHATAWLYRTFIETPPTTSTGIAVSIATTFFGLTYVLVTQNHKRRGLIRRYRYAELYLMKLDRGARQGLSRSDGGFRGEMMSYYSKVHWYSYAGFGFQAVFLIVVLFAPEKLRSMPQASQVGVFLGLTLLSISTVTFGFTDFFYTNTLSPLVTTERRATLVNIAVILVGFSYALQICSVGIFLALINPWLSLFASVTCGSLMVLITELRGVPALELMKERDLSEREMNEIMDV